MTNTDDNLSALFECFGECVVKPDGTRKERFPVPFLWAAGLNESRKSKQEWSEGKKTPQIPEEAAKVQSAEREKLKKKKKEHSLLSQAQKVQFSWRRHASGQLGRLMGLHVSRMQPCSRAGPQQQRGRSLAARAVTETHVIASWLGTAQLRQSKAECLNRMIKEFHWTWLHYITFWSLYTSVWPSVLRWCLSAREGKKHQL